jgi:hypothetical protein
MYTAEISRQNPTAFLFLVDQSGSMADSWGGGPGRSKAQEVADVMNNLLYTLVMRSTKGEGDPRDYFHVGVIGYGSQVGPCLRGELAESPLVPISKVANNPAFLEERKKKVPDGAGGLVETTVRFPIWVEPKADNGTPMCAAFRTAHDIIRQWTGEHPLSYPPTVINITDGESGDGDPSPVASEIQQLGNEDGNALVFNIHISSTPGSQMFSSSEESLPDQHARMLFRMSSPLPERMQQEASREGFAVTDASRGFAFNVDLVRFIQFLDIGTRPSNLR